MVSHRSTVIAGIALSTVGLGCVYEGTPTISGVLHRDPGIERTNKFVLMRAVPDHPDGFAVGRDYHGPLFFEDGCLSDHLDFPLPYMLWGDQDHVDATDGARWRLLVWETDDPTAHWVEPGEPFGTKAFHFNLDPHGSWAEVDVSIEHVAR